MMNIVEIENKHSNSWQISWSAVITGAIIAFGATFLFNFLTISLGLVLYTPSAEGSAQLVNEAFLWTLIGGFILLLLTGWVTGKLIGISHSRVPKSITGATHGFLAWALYLIMSLSLTVLLSETASDAFAAVSLMNVSVKESQSIKQSIPPNDLNELDPALTIELINPEELKAITKETGKEGMAIFFIFLWGAIACMIGSCLGFSSQQRAVALT